MSRGTIVSLVLFAVAFIAAVGGGFVTSLTKGGQPKGDEGWTIERFDSTIEIQPDNSLRITEAIDVDFGALQKHGIFRDIPIRYGFDRERDRVYALRVDRVTDAAGAAVPFQDGDDGVVVHIRIGDPARTVTGRNAYRITYRVFGALNPFADHDELFWNVNGKDWPASARQVSATVTLAQGGIERGDCFEGPTGSEVRCPFDLTARSATYRTDRTLSPGEQLTLLAALRKGAVAEPRLLFEKHELVFADFFAVDPPALFGAGVVALAGIALVGWGVWRKGRDERDATSSGTIVPEFEPPERLKPAQVGVLIDTVADPKDLTATIVDLAVRGYLAIEDASTAGKPDWRLHKRTGDPAALASYEKILYERLFGGRDEVVLSDIQGTFRATLDRAERALYDDAMRGHLFVADPERVRMQWGLLGGGVVVAGLLAAALIGFLLGQGLLGIAVSLAGVALVVASRWMPRRTGAGSELLRRVLGFRRYMETAETERQRFAEREELFTAYLPYAIVFGLVTKWAKAFAGLDIQRATAGWYDGSALNAIGLSGSMQSFSSTLSSALVTTPGGGGSSGFSGGGGGGGSGGGGGGGGGGSW